MTSSSNEPISRCELCGREKSLTRHHLIPRAVHGKRRFAKRHGKEEMCTRDLMICRLCHNGLHDLFTERELAEEFNTRETLLEEERVQRHVAWVRKQK